ncbi:LacI family DNA-binding transcriptional regulator [Scandinavium manionii]|uniref:LacI family DNA-binding transcriptional regulator n=1 Tax=Scandinavium manionii TaxID=2926520 RepID=UPI00135A7B5C|nr:LacI family DNA-binding transcriptional regulator [Scandinavium manionii]MCS2149542.1 LacI family transcriptional regulator [Scandinavium manionii]
MARKKPTISDVAKFADVSTAAVSMVLSGKGRISSWTTRRINEAIDQLGYVRNNNAATLRSGKTGLIAVLVHGIAHPDNIEMLQGVNARLDQEGKVAFILFYENQSDISTRLNVALNYNVDGVLIMDGSASVDAVEQRLLQRHIPCIVLTAAPQPNKNHQFSIHTFEGAALATQHFVNNGHRHIGFIGGDENRWDRIEKLAGYFSVLKNHNIEESRELIIAGSSRPLELENCVRELLTTHPWVTALLCYDTDTTKSVITAIKNAGRNIGKDNYIRRDISVICLEKMDDGGLLSPTITCLDFSMWQLGWNSAHQLSLQVDECAGNADNLAPTPQLLLRDSA